jgi:hypothetical protein
MSGGVDLSPGTTCRLAPVAWHLSLVSFSVRGVDPLPCGGVVGALPDVARRGDGCRQGLETCKHFKLHNLTRLPNPITNKLKPS